LSRYRNAKPGKFDSKVEKQITAFEKQVYTKSKGNFDSYRRTCIQSVHKMFKEAEKSLLLEYNKTVKSMSIGAANGVAGGKRPFGLIHTEMVRQSKRRKLEENNKHKIEGIATRLGASIRVWRKCFDKFLEFAPNDHPYRTFALEGNARCDRLTRRLEAGEIERVHDSEKAEDLYQKLNTETLRLTQKLDRLGTLKPQGFDGLIRTFEAIPPHQQLKCELVMPDVVNFLHRTQPSSDGTFKVVPGPVLDTICPVNPKKTWAGLYRAQQKHTFEDSE